MAEKLAGQVAIITGASSGIGAALARRLARQGMHLVLTARRADRLAEVASACGPGTHALPGDITDPAHRQALVTYALQTFGRLDVLVNNAGLGAYHLVADTPPEVVRQLFEVNVLALIDLTQRALHPMLAAGRGQIVNVSSVAGRLAGPPLTVYSSSKFAVTGFTEGLRRELRGSGVTVTLVTPAGIETEFPAVAAARGMGVDLRLNRRYPVEAMAREIERGILHRKREVAVPRALPFIARLAQFLPALADGPFARRLAKVKAHQAGARGER
jgi:short-subunit dehydrogenase